MEAGSHFYCILPLKPWNCLVGFLLSIHVGMVVSAYDFTFQSGRDAHVALRAAFQRCCMLAPSVLLFDPLESIALGGTQRSLDQSLVDTALLGEFLRILEESKRHGVTIIGMTSASTILPRVAYSFDEVVGPVSSFYFR